MGSRKIPNMQNIFRWIPEQKLQQEGKICGIQTVSRLLVECRQSLLSDLVLLKPLFEMRWKLSLKQGGDLVTAVELAYEAQVLSVGDYKNAVADYLSCNTLAGHSR